jgi:hypothetical protein
MPIAIGFLGREVWFKYVLKRIILNCRSIIINHNLSIYYRSLSISIYHYLSWSIHLSIYRPIDIPSHLSFGLSFLLFFVLVFFLSIDLTSIYIVSFIYNMDSYGWFVMLSRLTQSSGERNPLLDASVGGALAVQFCYSHDDRFAAWLGRVVAQMHGQAWSWYTMIIHDLNTIILRFQWEFVRFRHGCWMTSSTAQSHLPQTRLRKLGPL